MGHKQKIKRQVEEQVPFLFSSCFKTTSLAVAASMTATPSRWPILHGSSSQWVPTTLFPAPDSILLEMRSVSKNHQPLPTLSCLVGPLTPASFRKDPLYSNLFEFLINILPTLVPHVCIAHQYSVRLLMQNYKFSFMCLVNDRDSNLADIEELNIYKFFLFLFFLFYFAWR